MVHLSIQATLPCLGQSTHPIHSVSGTCLDCPSCRSLSVCLCRPARYKTRVCLFSPASRFRSRVGFPDTVRRCPALLGSLFFVLHGSASCSALLCLSRLLLFFALLQFAWYPRQPSTSLFPLLSLSLLSPLSYLPPLSYSLVLSRA
ncbi:hypothetical protein J3F83DRAFT_249963 [Trichoderma novae-zelandiae]